MSRWTCFLGLLLVLGPGCAPPEERWASRRRELVLGRLTEAACRAVPQAPVLLIGNPFAHRAGADPALREAEEAAVRGVRRGLGPGFTFSGIVHPELKRGALEDPRSIAIPGGATTPLSFLSAPGAWDRLREQHPETRLWISLIGVPADLAETRAWTERPGPGWALLLPDLRLIGPPAALRSAFADGRLVALVLARPGAPPEREPMAKDPDQEFRRRFILVTAGNLEEVLAAWPGLF